MNMKIRHLIFSFSSQECQWFNCLLYHIRHSLQILEHCVLGGSPAIPTYLARIVDALQQDMVPSDWLHPHAQPSPHSLISWLKGNACASSFFFSFFFPTVPVSTKYAFSIDSPYPNTLTTVCILSMGRGLVIQGGRLLKVMDVRFCEEIRCTT